MHVDWFVFFSQIVNFLLLVYLLKRFLYGRIIKAMDEREAKIVQRYQEAEEIKQKARAEAESFERKNRELDEISEELMNKARSEAQAYKSEMMKKAREDVDSMQKKWIDTLVREQASFLDELRKRAGQQVYSIARKALSDLADAALEEKIMGAFLKRLESIGGEEAESIRQSIGSDKDGIIIQSAFEVPQVEREKINKTLARYLNGNVPVQYDTSEEVVSGIEMRTSGHKISWSLNDYLNNLEENFSQVLEQASMGRT